MENKDELKEIDIKNCTLFYFDDIMWDLDINFGNILLQYNPQLTDTLKGRQL